MKRQWTPEELIAHWTLLPRDLALLANKRGPTRLGFAVLLLAFQQEGRFPRHRHEIPRVVVAHVAAHAAQRAPGVPTADWLQYDWTGRAIKYHRAQVRAALGYRAATMADAEALIAWLCDHVVAGTHQEGAVIAAAYQRLQAVKIEPPTPERMERIARSALHTYETTLQRQVLARLSPAHRAALDALLTTPRRIICGTGVDCSWQDFGPRYPLSVRLSPCCVRNFYRGMSCVRRDFSPTRLHAGASHHKARRAAHSGG